MWNYQVSRVLWLAKLQPIFLFSSSAWVQQAGSLSTVMLCRTSSVTAEYKSDFCWSFPEDLGLPSLCHRSVHWGFQLLLLCKAIQWKMQREGKCCLEGGRREGKRQRPEAGAVWVCSLPPCPNDWNLNPRPIPSIRLPAASQLRLLVAVAA